jgi:hypothetical protein
LLIIGKNLWKLLPQPSKSIVKKMVKEAIQKNEPVVFEGTGPGESWGLLSGAL